jgi:hypothetical protein
MAFILTGFGVFLSGLTGVIGNLKGTPGGFDMQTYFALIGAPLVSLGGLLAAMPVSLLFVHDKENGTLEYLLSLGLDQRDIFRAYLGASITLGLPLLAVGGAATALEDALVGVSPLLIATAVFSILALGLAVITLVTVLMTAFSALQKQPLGMNQPLGIAIGAFVLVAAMLVPLGAVSQALVLELALAGVVAAVSLALLSLTKRLIRREKMLP